MHKPIHLSVLLLSASLVLALLFLMPVYVAHTAVYLSQWETLIHQSVLHTTYALGSHKTMLDMLSMLVAEFHKGLLSSSRHTGATAPADFRHWDRRAYHGTTCVLWYKAACSASMQQG